MALLDAADALQPALKENHCREEPPPHVRTEEVAPLLATKTYSEFTDVVDLALQELKVEDLSSLPAASRKKGRRQSETSLPKTPRNNPLGLPEEARMEAATVRGHRKSDSHLRPGRIDEAFKLVQQTKDEKEEEQQAFVRQMKIMSIQAGLGGKHLDVSANIGQLGDSRRGSRIGSLASSRRSSLRPSRRPSRAASPEPEDPLLALMRHMGALGDENKPKQKGRRPSQVLLSQDACQKLDGTRGPSPATPIPAAPRPQAAPIRPQAPAREPPALQASAWQDVKGQRPESSASQVQGDLGWRKRTCTVVPASTGEDDGGRFTVAGFRPGAKANGTGSNSKAISPGKVARIVLSNIGRHFYKA